MIKETLSTPTDRSERIVVDEIFDDKMARILRAPRREDAAEGDVSIGAWGDEREEVVSTWRLEAFVGFGNGRKLREGDVFLVVDGSLFDDKYDPKKLHIAREVARQEHLLVDGEVSRREARMEIKQQSYLLTAVRLAQGNEHAVKTLTRRIGQKFDEEQ